MISSPKTLPRIGNQRLVEAARRLLQIVEHSEPMTRDELEAKLESVNEVSGTKIWKDTQAWFKFTFDDEARSLAVLETTGGGTVRLAENGKALLQADDFDRAFFQLLEERAPDHFSYVSTLLSALQQRVSLGKLELASPVKQTLQILSDGNPYFSQTAKGLLEDLGIIKEREDGWVIDPVRWSDFKADDDAIMLQILEDNGGELKQDTLRARLRRDFRWSRGRIDDTIDELLSSGQASTTGKYGAVYIGKVVR